MTIRISILCLLVTMLAAAGCAGENGSSASSVTVTNLSGSKLKGVTVVMGDSSGAMISSDSTDANGTFTFPGRPVNATFTAAHSCMRSGATTTTYSLDIRYDADGAVTLQLDDCSPSSGPPVTIPADPVLGTVTINIASAIPGVSEYELSTSMSRYLILPSRSVAQVVLAVNSFDLQEDGKLSFYVIGKNAQGSVLGYGMLQDQTFTDGMTVDISVDKPMSFIQYDLTNLPPDTKYLCSGISQRRTGKGSVFVDSCGTLSSSPSTTTLRVAYIPHLGDTFSYLAAAFAAESTSSFSKSSGQQLSFGPFPLLAAQDFNFKKALAIPGLLVTGTDTATPALTWTGVDPGAESYSLSAYIELSSGSLWPLYLSRLPAARATVVFPELPDSLAAFRPASVYYASITGYDWSDGLFRTSNTTYFFRQLFFATKANAAALPAIQRQQLRRQLPHGRSSVEDLFKYSPVPGR